MKLRTLVVALALGMLLPMGARAATDPGFDTGSCGLGANGRPGSNHHLFVDQSGAHGGNPAFTTIQAAVNAAAPNDHITVDSGTYHESVVVKTPGLRITGQDRNKTILDGHLGSDFLPIGIQVFADRVVLENMTAHHYSLHGFRWGDRGAGVTGYWGRYLTAFNNGDYGIFAFDARCGQFDHSFTWGNADSGFYVGNCYPCDMVIANIEADHNALGYSGTNAGGNLTLRNSTWHNNAMGIVPNSLDSEDRPPQRGIVIENNVVADNNTIDAPGTGIAGAFWGAGIVLAGGSGNQVLGNTVSGHAMGGIVISPLPDSNVWIPSGNTIWHNAVSHDAVKYPDSYDLVQGVGSGPNNCWANNTYGTTAPPLVLETVWACTGQTLTPPGGDPRLEVSLIEGELGLNGRVQSPWQTYIEPALDKPQLPDRDEEGLDEWLPELGSLSAH